MASDSYHIMGIDPGLHGAIVILDNKIKLVSKIVMPTLGKELDIEALTDIFGLHSDVRHCFMEHSQAIFGAGLASTFKFGYGFGVLETLIRANQIPYTLVKPHVWQRHAHKGIKKQLKPKERSSIAVRRRCPGIDLRKSDRSWKYHDGLIDAALICEYGIHQLASKDGK